MTHEQHQTGRVYGHGDRRATEVGFNAYLVKPLDVGVLLATLAPPSACLKVDGW
jgi:hypothetical protein